MLDRVTQCVTGESGEGECDLHDGASYFVGHFPGDPILPGAFIIEACGQLLAVVCRAAAERSQWRQIAAIDYLASVERFKFFTPARPGDVLGVTARVTRRVGLLLQARVAAAVRGQIVAEGVLNVTASNGM